MRKAVQLFTIAACLLSCTAWAEMIEEDPPLWVYTPGCGGPLFGGEVNGLCTGASIDIQNHSNKDLVAPLLVIAGIPDGGATAPTLTYSGTDYAPGGTPVWGWDGSGSGVVFSSASGSKDVYEVLGLSKGSGGAASESFGNWSSWEQSVNGFTPTEFMLFTYVIPVALLGGPSGGPPITIEFSGGLPFGTYVVAAGCINPEPAGANFECASIPPKGNASDVGSTPFTQAGLVNQQVVEPGTCTLLGLGLMGLIGLARRRR